MTEKNFDAILQGLYDKRKRRDEYRMMVLKAEIDNVVKETDAYYDGLHDAIKSIQERLAREEKEDTPHEQA